MRREDQTGARAHRAARILFAPQSPRPLRADAAADPARYRRWAEFHESQRLGRSTVRQPGPEIAFLLLVDRAVADGARTTLRSLARQTVALWHLSVTVVGAPDPELDAAIATELGELGGRGALGAGTGSPAGRRVSMAVQPSGTFAAEAYAAALEEISCPAFSFLEPGDELAPDAVSLLSAALVDADIAYADEDRIGAHGSPCTPVLKPDWSPELLLSWRYVGRPVAMRVAPAIAAGGIRAVPDGDWEHDLLLRVTERTPRVSHVAAILCHRHASDPSHRSAPERSPDPGSAAVAAAMDRRGELAEVERGPLAATWAIRRRTGGRPSVSAIVPFRDSTTLLRACADSLLATSADVDLELMLVDNGSTEPETATLLERLAADDRVVVRRDDGPFNWAAINNAAAAVTSGEVLLFVNDDVQALEAGWMGLLAAQALRPDVGAVGARLVYPDGRLQHAGVVLGMAGASGHVLAGLPKGRPGYLGMAVLTRDVSAVTGACMATSRRAFERLGGFDEDLGLDFNDVDYCLRARSRGLAVLYEAGATLVHHESPSRGTSGNEETAAEFLVRWHDAVDQPDPFLNENLSRLDFSAALDEPKVRSVHQ